MSSSCSKRAFQRYRMDFATLATEWQVLENSCPPGGTVFIHSETSWYGVLDFKPLWTPHVQDSYFPILNKWVSEVTIKWLYDVSEYVNAEKLLSNTMTPGKFSPSTHPYQWLSFPKSPLTSSYFSLGLLLLFFSNQSFWLYCS